MIGFRMLPGILLLSWGLILALHGLGLSNEPITHLIDIWWPLPVALWALVGLGQQVFRGSRGISIYLISLVLAALFLASNLQLTHHVHAWTIFLAIVVLSLGLGFLRGRVSIVGDTRSTWRGFQFGDVDVDPYQGMVRIRHSDRGRSRKRGAGQLIGDIHLDLSQVVLPEGESPYDLSCLVGDITVLVPEGLAVRVEAETMVGDIRVFQERMDGIGRHLHYETEGFADAPVRARVTAQAMVGDITVRSV